MALIITARNLTGLNEISDYEVGAWINERPIWKGIVLKHRRDDGWAALVQMIVDVYNAERRDSQPASESR